jgi:hypothetical protein
MQDARVKLNPGLPWQKQHSTEGIHFTPAIGLDLRKKLVKHYHTFLLWRNLDTSESRLEIPGKFCNVVLEKDGEDQLDLSCEKCGSITYSQGEEEYKLG